MSIEIAWERGGQAMLVSTDGNKATLVSTKAFAPGTPLRGKVDLASTDSLRLKVHHCRKQADGRFLIEGRWLDLSRAMREEVLARTEEKS